MDSNNVWYQKTLAQTKTILGIDTLSGNTTADLDSLYTKTSHIVNVMDYVDSYDTTNGWQGAINAAINDIKSNTDLRSTVSFGNTTAEVIVPAQRMALQSPIILYSGITLKGQGVSSELVEDSGFAGKALIEFEGTNYADDCKIDGFELTTTSVRAIGLAGGNGLLNSIIQNITLNAVQGIILDEYTQFTKIQNIYSYGNIDTLIFLYGNDNRIYDVDKEGDTGSSAGAYIYVKDPNGLIQCGGNELHHILIEGGTSVNKSAIILTEAASTTLRDFWFEPTNTNGYSLVIEGGGIIQIKGQFFPSSSTVKIKVDSVEFLDIEYLNVSSEKLSEVIEKDSLTTIRVGMFATDQALYSPYRLIDLEDGFLLDNVYTRSTKGTSISTIYKPQFYGENWFPPVFENQLITFTPDDISGLEVWYEGDYGLSISGWLDKLGVSDVTKEFHPMIAVTVDDTIPINFYNSATTWDSIKYKVDDSVRVQFEFGANGTGTDVLSITDTLTGSGTITSFNDATIPANSEVQMYFIYMGDTANKIWFDIYKDGSGAGNNMTFYNSPTLGTNNSIPTVIFNGVDEYGKTDTLDITQPTTVYMVWKHITYDSTKDEHILDGINESATQTSFRSPGDGGYAVNAGAQIGVVGITLGTFNITKIEYDSSNSVVAINDGGEFTGNAGGNDMLGLSLAHEIDTTYCNMEVSAILVYDNILSDYEDNLVIDYLSNKYDVETSVWSYSTAPDTAENLSSGVSDGNMTRLVWNTPPASNQVYRTFNIDTAKVGQQLTFSIYCKVDAGATLANPYVSGCGVTSNFNMRTYDDEWYILTETFTPASVGILTVGVQLSDVSEAYIDEPYLTKTVR